MVTPQDIGPFGSLLQSAADANRHPHRPQVESEPRATPHDSPPSVGHGTPARTKVVITVDMEPSVAGAFDDPTLRPLLHEPVAGIVGTRSEALGFLLDTLTSHALTATFFVETVHTRAFSDREMGSYVEILLEKEQDVQLHLHPCWLAYRDGELDSSRGRNDNCSDMTTADLAALIVKGCEQIHAWTGRVPTGMRTGNFATSMSVFEAMRAAGLHNSSNICAARFRPAEAELAVAAGAHEFCGIRELPVTCFIDRSPVARGPLRPLQVNAISAAEQITALEQIHARGGGVATIITHPFDFLKQGDYRFSGMRANRVVQRRFAALCRYLDAHRDRFEVVTLDQAARSVPTTLMAPIVGHALLSLLRTAVQVVNDYVL